MSSTTGTHGAPSPSIPTRALTRFATMGGRQLKLAAQLDALRTRGPAIALHQRRSLRGGLASEFEKVRSTTYTRIWRETAAAVGADLRPLGDDFLLLQRDRASTVVRENLVVFNDGPGLALSGDKPLMHRMLVGAGIPVPEHIEVDWRDYTRAIDFLESGEGPCVVKPATGTGGGAGVTGSVVDPDDMARVCLSVGRWGSRVLVERTVVGSEYRLLFLDGVLLGAVQRTPPVLACDGRSTLAELVAAENERRVRAGDELRAIRIDLDLELTLALGGLSLRSVPAVGARVQIKSAVSENARAENATAHDLSPAVIGDAARAGEVANLRFVGVDLVTPDPGVSLAESGGAVLEVNSPPGLHYHYVVREPATAVPVAVPVLEKALQEARARARTSRAPTVDR